MSEKKSFAKSILLLIFFWGYLIGCGVILMHGYERYAIPILIMLLIISSMAVISIADKVLEKVSQE